MNRLIYLSLLLLMLPTMATAKKKAKDNTPKKTPYENIISQADSTMSAKGDFLSLYRVKDKLYIDMPKKYLERSILIGSTVAESSNSQVAMVGYKSKDPIHVCFELQDSTVLMKEIQNSVLTNGNYDLAIQRNYVNPIIEKFSVAGFNADSTRILFDMTDFFISDKELISPIAKNVSILKVTATYKKELAKLSTLRAFHNNVSISTRMSYDYSLSFMGADVMKGSLTAKVTRTMLLLPDEKMKPRFSDSRVGVFLTEKRNLDTRYDGMRFLSLAHRWRIEPKDTAAWLRGELTEPVKPIVWYVDDAFPKQWMEPLKRSVTNWNKAFEKIGFKNVMQARNFPTLEEDPNFDPNNLAYSCIRYVPIPVQNAQGPSWVDPRTGEIINASVMVYNDVVRLINNWRFVQTAQIDTCARHSKMPDKVMDEALTYVFSHEIGHTLGLMHNMGASSSFPVDSLRSASFTQRYGTTPSIMDYARWNYVAQPGDKGVRVSPPDMGIYDEFAIKWLYSPVIGDSKSGIRDTLTPEQEQKVLEQWVDEKAKDVRFRYGRQQVYSRYDPSALEEDLGDDPMKAGDYGIKNLKYILDNMSRWITNDSDYTHRRELYKSLVSQYTGYLTNTLEIVGGVRLTSVKEGSQTLAHESVSAEEQHKAIEWVISRLRNSQWIDAPELTKNFPMAVNTSVTLTNSIGRQMISRTNNVLVSSVVVGGQLNGSQRYTQQDYFNDLYTLIFQPTLRGKTLTNGDKLLQRSIVSACAGKVSSLSGAKKSGLSSFVGKSGFAGTTVDDIVTYGLDPTGYVEQHVSELRRLDAQYGDGFVASMLPPTDGCGCLLHSESVACSPSMISFGEGQEYGFQHDVTTDIIDESQALYLQMLQKVRKLITSKVASAPAADKAHYQALLLQLQGAVK